jgi:hypothetical protein
MQTVIIPEPRPSYTIAAKPTWYEGVRFRSRLEATWAAFFDLTGFRWEYEPYDLQFWTPDFVIHHDAHLPSGALVEVKPLWGMAFDATNKIFASGCHTALLLGSYPGGPNDDLGGQSMMGLFAQRRLGGDTKYEPFAPSIQWQRAWRDARNQTQWKPQVTLPLFADQELC